MAELSARQTLVVVSPGLQPLRMPDSLAPAPAPNSEPASANTAPLMPRSSGTNGIGKRISAVVAQKVSPPSASSVFRSRGPKPARSKPRMVSPPLKKRSIRRTSWPPQPWMWPPIARPTKVIFSVIG